MDKILTDAVATPSAGAAPVPAIEPAVTDKAAPLSPVVGVVLFLCWIGSVSVALYLKQTQILHGLDGGYMRELAERQFAWGTPLFYSGLDWFQGLGDVYFPTHFNLLPAFVAAAFLKSAPVGKVLTCVVIVAELSLATVVFGRSLGLSRNGSIAGAILACLLMFPFTSPTLIYGVIALAPQMASIMAAALLAAACFLYFGRRGWSADLPFAVAVIVLLVWTAQVSITLVVLVGPFLVLCVVSGLISVASRRELWAKLGLIGAGLIVAIGPAIYFIAVIVDTAAIAFPVELENNRATFYNASMLFHWYTWHPAGPLLVVAAVAGAALAIFDRRRPVLRVFAITLLTYLGTRLMFAVAVILFDFWRGPGPIYFEMFVVPLYALFACYGIGRILGVLNRILSMLGRPVGSRSGATVGIVVLGSATAIILAMTTRSIDSKFYYPPTPTPFTTILAEQVGLKPGSAFRGRAATMTGLLVDRSMTWGDLHALDGAVTNLLSNEMRLVGLNYFGIPVLFQYTATITPAFYAVTTRLLGRPDDRQNRNSLVWRKPDRRILALLGVRFVITDAAVASLGRLHATLPVEDRTLHLYEIENVNLGDYSPTLVNKILSAPEIIDRLANPGFDPRTEVIADTDATGLLPARNARLTFLGSSLKVEAESPGRSLLVLPLEFSRCLDIVTGDSEKPVLLRANLLETGVLFSSRLDATISLRTGPFLNPECRLRDFFDLRNLDVMKIPRRPS